LLKLAWVRLRGNDGVGVAWALCRGTGGSEVAQERLFAGLASGQLWGSSVLIGVAHLPDLHLLPSVILAKAGTYASASIQVSVVIRCLAARPVVVNSTVVDEWVGTSWVHFLSCFPSGLRRQSGDMLKAGKMSCDRLVLRSAVFAGFAGVLSVTQGRPKEIRRIVKKKVVRCGGIGYPERPKCCAER
jgi:hypothetical protein